MEQDYEEIIEDGPRKSPQDIIGMYDILKESISNYILKVLVDNAATEDNPLECNICLEFGACGLSCIEMPLIEGIYEDDGVIWCKIDNNDDYIELDELCLDDQMDIIRNISD